MQLKIHKYNLLDILSGFCKFINIHGCILELNTWYLIS